MVIAVLGKNLNFKIIYFPTLVNWKYKNIIVIL